jgi:hypothetical protein
MMKSKRALKYHEHIGGHQYRLRIQDSKPYDVRQWWVYDFRTHTIRAASNRKMAISIQNGGNNWMHNGYVAVTKKYKGEDLQKIRWFSGSRRNIRDLGRRCLDVHGGSDSNNRHVHWWVCHNGLNQGWTVDTKGTQYPQYPLANKVRFTIRSRMQSGKTVSVAEKSS